MSSSPNICDTDSFEITSDKSVDFLWGDSVRQNLFEALTSDLKVKLEKVKKDIMSQEVMDKVTVKGAGNEVPNIVKDGSCGYSGTCQEHDDDPLEYWCQDDQKLVCKHCLIFGEHKGHMAILARNRHKTMVSSVLEELEDYHGVIIAAKTNIESLVAKEELRLKDKLKKEVATICDDLKINLTKTMSSLESEINMHVNCLQNPADCNQNTSLENIKKFLIESKSKLFSSIIPGTVEVMGKKLVLTAPSFSTQPIIQVDDFHNNANKLETPSATSSLMSLPESATIPQESSPCWGIRRIPTLDLTIKPEDMLVVDVGTPAKFYCGQLVDRENHVKEIKRILDESQEEIPVKCPLSGQGVLVRRGEGWVRASVVRKWGARDLYECELVDLGQKELVRLSDIINLPSRLADMCPLLIPVTLVSCGDREFDDEVLRDWVRLVEGQVLQVSNQEILLNGESLLDTMVFLGHFPNYSLSYGVPRITFQSEIIEEGRALVCFEQDLLTPNSIYLLMQTPMLEMRLLQLEDMSTCPSMAGVVTSGSAVMAPWDGLHYRAKVLGVGPGPRLQVLFVDHSNVDWVDWWECGPLPEHLLFPPLTKRVKLAGLTAVGGGEDWSKETLERLSQLLIESPNVQVVVKCQGDSWDNLPSVDLVMEGDDKTVTEILVIEGLALAKFNETIKMDLSSSAVKYQLPYPEDMYSITSEVEVDILHVITPDEVWLRLLVDQTSWSLFNDQLQILGERENAVPLLSRIQEGRKLVVRHEGQWVRIVVTKIGYDIIEARLIDWGQVIRVDKNKLVEQDGDLMSVPAFCSCVSIVGIKPAGGAGWTLSSVEELTYFLTKARVMFVPKMKIKSANTDVLVGNLDILDLSSNGPMEVVQEVRMSAARHLLNLGLALPSSLRNSSSGRVTTVNRSIGQEYPLSVVKSKRSDNDIIDVNLVETNNNVGFENVSKKNWFENFGNNTYQQIINSECSTPSIFQSRSPSPVSQCSTPNEKVVFQSRSMSPVSQCSTSNEKVVFQSRASSPVPHCSPFNNVADNSVDSVTVASFSLLDFLK